MRTYGVEERIISETHYIYEALKPVATNIVQAGTELSVATDAAHTPLSIWDKTTDRILVFYTQKFGLNSGLCYSTYGKTINVIQLLSEVTVNSLYALNFTAIYSDVLKNSFFAYQWVVPGTRLDFHIRAQSSVTQSENIFELLQYTQNTNYRDLKFIDLSGVGFLTLWWRDDTTGYVEFLSISSNSDVITVSGKQTAISVQTSFIDVVAIDGDKVVVVYKKTSNGLLYYTILKVNVDNSVTVYSYESSVYSLATTDFSVAILNSEQFIVSYIRETDGYVYYKTFNTSYVNIQSGLFVSGVSSNLKLTFLKSKSRYDNTVLLCYYSDGELIVKSNRFDNGYIKPIPVADSVTKVILASSDSSDTQPTLGGIDSMLFFPSRYGSKYILYYTDINSPEFMTEAYLTEPYWAEVSPSNRYAMFDAEVNTSTTSMDEIAVEVHPSETATGISFFNLVGSSLNITVTDSMDVEVYNVDVSLDGTIIATSWDWWFRTFRQKQTYVNSEFPPFYNSTIKATLTGSGEVAIGAMQVGTSEYIGTALQGTGFGCDDYSIIERVFDKTKFVKKGNAQLTNVELYVEGWRMSTTVQTLRSTLSTPATFVPTNDDQYSFMSTLGYYQTYNATIEIDGKITMEIRELT
jgi:hypothetical protein